MRLVTHDNIETWVERRTSGKEVVKPPFTLNEVDQPRSLSYIEQGEWERVEERNPKLKGKGNIETMYGGFELDFKDLESFDYRLCIRRAEKEEWKGDLLARVTIDDHPPETLYMEGKAGQVVYHTINSNTREISTCTELTDPDHGVNSEFSRSKEEMDAEIDAILRLNNPDMFLPPDQGGNVEETLGVCGLKTMAEIEDDEETMGMIAAEMTPGMESEPSILVESRTVNPNDQGFPVPAVKVVDDSEGQGSTIQACSDISSDAGCHQVGPREMKSHTQSLSPIPEVMDGHHLNLPSPGVMTLEGRRSDPTGLIVPDQQLFLLSQADIHAVTVEPTVPATGAFQNVPQSQLNSGNEGTDRLASDDTTEPVHPNTSPKTKFEDATSTHHDPLPVDSLLPLSDPQGDAPRVAMTTSNKDGSVSHLPSSENVTTQTRIPAVTGLSLISGDFPQVDASQQNFHISTDLEDADFDQELADAVAELLKVSAPFVEPLSHSGCHWDPSRAQQAPSTDNTGLPPLHQGQEVPAPTMSSLRLLNSAEDRLGTIKIDIHRGTLINPVTSHAESLQRAKLFKDIEAMDFDPERIVHKSPWETVDDIESPWCRFVYEFGPSELWKQAYHTITDADRELAHRTEQARLAIEKRKMEQLPRLEREREDRSRRLREAVDFAKIQKAAQVALQEENARIEASRKEVRLREERNRKQREKRAMEKLAKGGSPKKVSAVTATAAPIEVPVPAPAPHQVPATRSKPPSKEIVERKESEVLVPESPPATTLRHVSRLPLSQVQANFHRQRHQARRPSSVRTSPKDDHRSNDPVTSRSRHISPILDSIVDDDEREPEAGPSRLICPKERRGREVSRHREFTRQDTRHRHGTDTRSRSPIRHRADPDTRTHRHSDTRVTTETERSRHDRPAERYRDTHPHSKTKPIPKSIPLAHPSTRGYLARRERSDGPRAYGLAQTTTAGPSRSKLENQKQAKGKAGREAEGMSETESQGKEELDSIEEQRQAVKRRDALRQEQKRKIEEKEARRAAKRRDQHQPKVDSDRRQTEEPRRPTFMDKVRRIRPERIDRPERPDRLERVEREDKHWSRYEIEQRGREWRAKKAGDAAQGRLDRRRETERRTAREVIDLTHLDD